MRCFVVDAFTDVAFAGNPAAVVLLEDERDAAWMQQVAAEFNLSETAHVAQRTDGGFDLRWFTPTVEVDLCGHATLASAHVLAELGHRGTLAFHTRSGVLTATAEDDAIALDFPVQRVEPIDAPDGLDGLGVPWVATWRGGADVLVEVADAGTVAAVRPDLARLADVECRGVIVTARADDGADHDFVSRFFGARVGVGEDPVTGSAHCALAPFWGERLGRTELAGAQLSERGGRVRTELRGDRVVLRGTAVTVLDGMLRH